MANDLDKYLQSIDPRLENWQAMDATRTLAQQDNLDIARRAAKAVDAEQAVVPPGVVAPQYPQVGLPISQVPPPAAFGLAPQQQPQIPQSSLIPEGRQSNPASPLGPQQVANERIGIYSNLADLQRQAGEAGAQGALESSKTYEQSASDIAARLAHNDQAHAQFLLDQKAKEDQLDKQIAAAQAQKIDPDHYWSSKGIAGNILNGISVGLGAFSNAINKTGNPAMQIIQKAIDNDMEAQKGNIANNWQAIKQRHELMDTAENRELHRQSFELTHQLGALKVVEQRVKGIAESSAAPEIRAKAGIMIADLQDRMVATREKLFAQQMAAAAAGTAQVQKLEDSANKDVQDLMATGKFSEADAIAGVYNRPKYRALALSGRAPASVLEAEAQKNNVAKQYLDIQKDLAAKKSVLSESAYKKYEASIKPQIDSLQKSFSALQYKPSSVMPDLVLKQPEQEKDLRERGINFMDIGPSGQMTPKQLLAPSPQAAEAYRKSTQPVYDSLNIVNRLKQIRQETGGGFVLDRDKMAEVNQLVNQLVGQLGHMADTGVLSESEYKRNKDLIPDASGYNLPGRNLDVRLNSLANSLGGKQRAALQTYGLNPGNLLNPPSRPGVTPETGGQPTPQQLDQAAGVVRRAVPGRYQ